MSNDTTLATLKLQALDYADMPNSSFPVTARLVEYINKGLGDLHDLLINSDQDYYLSTQAYTILAGTETYALPTDFQRATKVWYTGNSNRRVAIPVFQLGEMNGSSTTPLQGGSAELWYQPELTELVNDADKVSDVMPSLPVGWEDYVALHAAARLLIREESDPGGLLAERGRIENKITALLEPRDEGGERSIQDTTGRWRQDPFSDAFPVDHPSLRYKIMGQYIRFISLSSW